MLEKPRKLPYIVINGEGPRMGSCEQKDPNESLDELFFVAGVFLCGHRTENDMLDHFTHCGLSCLACTGAVPLVQHGGVCIPTIV